MDKRIERIAAQFEEQKVSAQRVQWESYWDQVAVYVQPDIYDKYHTLSGGPETNPECLDSTAQDSNLLLASSLHFAYTNKAVDWFSAGCDDAALMKQSEIKQYYQEVTRTMMIRMEQSSFYPAIFANWLHLPSFGTSALFIEGRDDGQIRVKPLPIYSVYPVENWEGMVDTVFVLYRFTPYQLVSRWPHLAGVEDFAKVLARDPYKTIEVVHYAGPVDGFEGALFDERKAFVDIYYWPEKKMVLNLKEGRYDGFHEFPYCVPRWYQPFDAPYGIGPGIYALPTLKSLNKTIEIKFEVLGLVSSPPQKTTEDNILEILPKGKMEPGAVVVCRNPDRLLPYLTGANIPITEMEVDRMVTKIEDMFFTKELRLAPDRPEMTAYEINKRLEIVHRLLGPVGEKVERELLNQALGRIYGILDRAKKFPERPAALNKKGVDRFEYSSPMAMARKLASVQKIQAFLGFLGSLLQVEPDLRFMLDNYKAAQRVAEQLGFPLDLLVDQKKYDKIVQENRQMAMQREQLAQAETAAGTAQRAGRAAQSMKQAGIL